MTVQPRLPGDVVVSWIDRFVVDMCEIAAQASYLLR
jgi:hypothetical protein